MVEPPLPAAPAVPGDLPERWEEFRAEVIDRLARIETKLDSLPCQRHEKKIERLESNQEKYLAVTIGLVIALSIFFSKLPWPL